MKQKFGTAMAVLFFPATIDGTAHCADAKTLTGTVSEDNELVDEDKEICPIVEMPVGRRLVEPDIKMPVGCAGRTLH